MKTYTVKFRSFNREDYTETVSGKNEQDAFKNANRMTIKRDDRDKVISIVESPHKKYETWNG